IADVIGIANIAAGLLISDSEGVCAEAVGAGETPDGVAITFYAIAEEAIAGNGVIIVFGSVDVEVETEVLTFRDIEIVVQVAVILLGNVVDVRIVERCGQVVGKAVGTAE